MVREAPWKIGCCGFPVGRARYYETFGIAEIQQTFYQLPQKTTIYRWRTEAPSSFTFTLKAWQLITHEPTSPTYRRLKEKIPKRKLTRYGAFQPTEEVLEAWDRTRQIAEILKASVVLFQSPASFTPTWEHQKNLRKFFRIIRRSHLRFTWEPRGADWTLPLVRALCRTLDLIHCVDPFLQAPVTSAPYYLRVHGGKGYAHRFDDEELKSLRLRLTALPGLGYLFFNNVSMWEDAQRFQKLMAG